MNPLLSEIKGVVIENVIDVDGATLEEAREVICKWIEFEIEKSRPHPVRGVTAAAIASAIQKFIAAVRAAQRFAEAKRAADEVNNKNEVKVELEELRRKKEANRVLEGAERDRYDEILERLNRMDAGLDQKRSIFSDGLDALWDSVPEEFKPAGSQCGPK